MPHAITVATASSQQIIPHPRPYHTPAPVEKWGRTGVFEFAVAVLLAVVLRCAVGLAHGAARDAFVGAEWGPEPGSGPDTAEAPPHDKLFDRAHVPPEEAHRHLGGAGARAVLAHQPIAAAAVEAERLLVALRHLEHDLVVTPLLGGHLRLVHQQARDPAAPVVLLHGERRDVRLPRVGAPPRGHLVDRQLETPLALVEQVDRQVNAAADGAALPVGRHEEATLTPVLEPQPARDLHQHARIDLRALDEDDRPFDEAVRAEEGIGAKAGERDRIIHARAADRDVGRRRRGSGGVGKCLRQAKRSEERHGHPRALRRDESQWPPCERRQRLRGSGVARVGSGSR
mmetsp:Transcript_380/g.961  ORF Transcript_380/g.961 Transcript_380/m.961 type:complete len:343 (-) Transcript_380:133-1161(-)